MKRALLGFLFVASLGLTVPAQAQLTSPLRVDQDRDPRWDLPLETLRFEGHARAESLLILKSSGLEFGHRVSKTQLRNAFKSLYALGLFSDFYAEDLTPAEGATGRALTFYFFENPRITELSWEGYDHIGEEDLEAEIDLRVGDLLTRRKLFHGEKALQKAYEDEGFASAQIQGQVRPSADPSEVGLNFLVMEGKRVKIDAVEFVGNNAYSDDDLEGKIELKPNSLFRRKRYTAERLRTDKEKLVVFYQNHGFKDASLTGTEVLFSEDQGEVTLQFAIDEGPLYQFGEVIWVGNEAVPTEALDLVSPIRRGEPFSQEKIDETTAEAYSLYTEEGYLLELQVIPTVAIDADTVHVSFQIQEGNPSTVSQIKIVGNTRTKERVIRRELTLVPGRLLRRSVLMRSHRDVFALGYFEDVGVDYNPSGDGSSIDVVLNVKEKSSGTATAGAGFSSETGITGFLEFGHNNLFGTGKSLNLHLERGSRRKTYDISFTEPWAFNTPTSVGFHVFNSVRDLDFYDERRRGFSINLGRPWFFRVPDYTRAFASYTLEDLDFRDFDGLDSASEEFLKESNGTVSRLTFSMARNSTNSPFYPTAGSRTTVRTEFAGGLLGGETDYIKPTLDHRNYFVPFGKPTVMLRHRVGYLTGYGGGASVPGNETFRLGGTRSDYLRGYDDWYVVPEDNVRPGTSGNEVRFPGGRVMYTLTAEYQFPIVNPVQGLFFFDAGNTWNAWRDFSFSSLQKGVGAGIRLEIPLLGNVGFDYAYGIDRGKWQPHLIIGSAF